MESDFSQFILRGLNRCFCCYLIYLFYVLKSRRFILKNYHFYYNQSMLAEQEQSLKLREKRVVKLQTMLTDIKKEIIRKVLRISQDTASNKKYRKNRKILNERARKATNFIKNSAETFFTLMCHQDVLSLTTEADVIQKVEKFKKNVNNACQKMMQNIEEGDDIDRNYRLGESRSKIEENEDLDDEVDNKKESGRRSPSRSRSKNFKISNEATLSMMEWLLQNFENPYPSNEEKQVMAKEGNISLVKVNNWFINARERTVKSYFSKE